MFDTPELVMRAYDAVTCMYGQGPSDLNFPKDTKDATFLSPPYWMYSRNEEKARSLANMDEVAMTKYVEVNPAHGD